MYTFKRAGKTRTAHAFEFEHEGRRVRRGGFPTKRLAELAGEALRRQLQEGRVERVYGVREFRARDAPTLSEYVEGSYRAHHLPRLEPSTQKSARSQLGKLVAKLGRHRLTELGPHVLDEYVKDRFAEGVGASQVTEEINRLSRVVNHARARLVIVAHPFPRYERPRATRRDIRIVTIAEERHLLRAARRDFADWIAIGLDTGLRKGELRVLEPGWVDWQARELRIRQPKTKHVKVIPLTRRAMKIFARRRCVAGAMLGIGGRRMSAPWIDKRWAEAKHKAGLQGVRFHDLRHTFATRALLESGSVPEVGEMLGHKPPYTTTMRYVHPLAEAKRRVIARMERRYGGPGQKEIL